MRIIVIGAGDAGYNIAQKLSRKNDVIIIELQESACQRAGELDVQVIHGNGADIKVLQRAGVKKSDLVVAVTGVDEINILACMGAKLLSRKIKTIARVSNPDYINKPVDHREELGMDAMICPELSLAREITQVISVPSALDVEDFVGGKVKMMEFEVKPEHEIAGRKLKEGILPASTVLTGILRGEKLIIPHGDDAPEVGDRIVVIGKTDALESLRESFGGATDKKQRILIVGGGNVGFYLLEELTKLRYDITLIESDKKRCSELAEMFPDVLVIHGDGTDLNLLKEENLASMDTVIAVTNNDEKNLLCSLLAKQLGARKVISRTDRPEYAALFEMVGVDVAINPILATVNEVMKFTMQIGVESLVNLEGEKAKIIELTAKQESRIVNRQLKDIRFPGDAIIAAIVKGEEVIVPTGRDIIKSGDKVVIFCLPGAVEDVEKLFK